MYMTAMRNQARLSQQLSAFQLRGSRYGSCSLRRPQLVSIGQTVQAAISHTRHYSSNLPASAPNELAGSTQSKPITQTSYPIEPDHRTLGVQQSLFFTKQVSPGSPLFLPHGTRILNKLQAFLRAQYAYYGFEEVLTPTIYKRSLWEQSGHWEKYSKDMFEVKGRGASGIEHGREIGEEEEYGLKPMNCPGHCLIFKYDQRSYRDLPIRYADFSPLHRNEISGALSGLTRARRFHQDDAHIFCRPSQIASEISSTLDFINTAYTVFKLPSYRLVLSTRPMNYIGDLDSWVKAETALTKALDASGAVWTTNQGDGAFYGPKIDILVKGSDGREHQTATIQLDFQLPERFDLGYVSPAPEAERKGLEPSDPAELSDSGVVRPVIIHRAIFGSLERFMALLIEHYNGRWPFWLSPRQAILLSVFETDEIMSYAKAVQKTLSGIESSHQVLDGDLQTPTTTPTSTPQSLGRRRFHVDIDLSNNSLRKKVRDAREKKYNHVIVLGEKNVAARTLSVTSWIDNPDAAEKPVYGKTSDMSPEEVYDMFVALEECYQ